MLDLDMGKYAAFVWPAYGVSAVVLAGMVVETLLRARRYRREAEKRQAESQPPANGIRP